MGATNSVPVIKSGDWEHHICWLDSHSASSSNVGIETNNATHHQQEQNQSLKRRSTLTSSLNNKYQSAKWKTKNWKKLRQQQSLEDSKSAFEMESIASTPKTTRTTYTEEMFI